MYKITANGEDIQQTVVEIVADELADISTLPVTFCPGSSCIVIENSSVWMLGNDKVWHEL